MAGITSLIPFLNNTLSVFLKKKDIYNLLFLIQIYLDYVHTFIFIFIMKIMTTRCLFKFDTIRLYLESV